MTGRTLLITCSSGLTGSEAMEHFDRQGNAMFGIDNNMRRAFAAHPRPAEVYNLGGGRENSVSMLEAIAKLEQLAGKRLDWTYMDENRKGDHICYISDLRKFRAHYPSWRLTKSLNDILKEIVAAEQSRSAAVFGNSG